tara:strand:+ start:50611 stop:50802 length:192 start_codon:yes stop_codon:yes gene_type:complete
VFFPVWPANIGGRFILYVVIDRDLANDNFGTGTIRASRRHRHDQVHVKTVKCVSAAHRHGPKA